MATEILLTIREVQDRLKVSDETVYRHIKSGKLRAIRVGNLWRIPEVALRAFLEKGETR